MSKVVTLLSLSIVLHQAEGDFKLRLLHTNDMHARYDEVGSDLTRCQTKSSKCYGGFARVKAAVDDLRKEAKQLKMSTLYLDAGDVFKGTIYHTKYKSSLAAKMMNLLRPDAITLGTHEFDDGVKGLSPYLKDLTVPVVCSNINASNESGLKKGKILPFKIFQFGKVKVGVVGYITTDVKSKHLGKAKITDEIESVRKVTEKMTKKGVNIIIALGQSGFNRDIEVAAKVVDVDVVVGGHSHTYLYSGSNPTEREVGGPYPTMVMKEVSNKNGSKKQGPKVPVVQAYHGTKYLGRLDLTFDDKGQLKEHDGSLIELYGKMRKDKTIVKQLSPYTRQIKRLFGYTVGATKVFYDGGPEICRTQECNMGNLIADAFVEYASTTLGKKFYVALVDSKSIKGSLYPKGNGKSGKILFQDAMSVLPYTSYLKVLSLKGIALRNALENGVDGYDAEEKGLLSSHLLQVSGLKVQFNMTKPLGQRLTKVQVAPNFKDLADGSNYKVVVSSYLASHKNKYPSLYNKGIAGVLPQNVMECDVLAEYIKKHSPLSKKYAKVEGRITIYS